MAALDVDKIRARYAAPYYLSMPDLDEAGVRRFRATARAASVDEVLWMLETKEWRCRKIGAWFSLTRDEPEVLAALRRSLLTSRGYLTAPDLGVALAERLGADALPALLEYQSTALREDHGSQGLISALIRSLGGRPLDDAVSERDDAVSERDEAWIVAMQRVAHLISQG